MVTINGALNSEADMTSSIPVKDQKMLWGRAAGRCSFPGCRKELHVDETETDDPALIGEICHIESETGPRANSAMSAKQRNSYANTILMCRNDHTVIDAQENEYTVERLHQMKAEHEAWVKGQLGFDAAKEADDEAYAGMIDTWEKLAHLDEWHAWSSHILGGGHPCIFADVFRDLDKLRTWLLNRVWPGRYADLENAFENFRRVLGDFYEQFQEHAEFVGPNDEKLCIQKFYQISEWNPERYEKLFKDYEFQVDLVQDLMLELTRAANLIADLVRKHILRSYRIAEGLLVIEHGPVGVLQFRQEIVAYSTEERGRPFPYPGHQAFLTERAERDLHFGKGTKP